MKREQRHADSGMDHTSNFQGRKRGKRQADVDIDYISNLPDCIQSYILSFLTAKEAVQTCTLSTRWRNVWTFVPVLNFDFVKFLPDSSEHCHEILQEYEEKFGRFVCGVLKNREASSRLDTFRLTFEYRPPVLYRTPVVDLLAESILRVVEMRPRVIFIQIQMLFWTWASFFQPWLPIWTAVFTCSSLQKMDLLMGDLSYCNFQSIRPVSISLPSLKALRLSNVTNHDELVNLSIREHSFVKKLLAGCPVLEELVLTTCSFGFAEIASNTLKKLVINGKTSAKGIQISCPSLASLVIKSVWTGEILLKNMSSLVEAEMTSIDSTSTDPIKLKILGGLSAATSIKLQFDQSHIMELLARDTSNCKTFHNLESLELGDCCSSEGFDLIAQFIRNSPNLKKLTLHLSQPGEDGVDKVAVQKCRDLLDQRESLKMVKIIEYEVQGGK